jgi:hypothetical protein
MSVPEHSRFTVRGFSAKRMAYTLVIVSVLLLPFHTWADYRGDEYLAAVAFAFAVIALILGFRIPRNDRRRFLAFAVGLIVFVFHFLLQKL